jgi:GAF domain-containing protein
LRNASFWRRESWALTDVVGEMSSAAEARAAETAVARTLAVAGETSRRAVQQAAVAAFGRFALQSRDITETTQRAVDVATSVLAAPMGAVHRLLERPRRLAMMHSGGPLGLPAVEDFEVDPELLAVQQYTTEPLIIGDWRADPTFPLPVERAAGVRAILSVSVLVEGRPWGRLAVFDVEPRQFGGTDVDFVQSVANVLAAALERERVEHAQAAVAEFGRFVLESRDITASIERAVEVVTQVLEAPVGAVVQLLGPGRVAVVHSRGPVGLAPREDLEFDPELLTTHISSDALSVGGWHNEPRAPGPRAGRAAGVRASLSVTVPVDGRPWGRLIVSDTEPRQFGGTDVDFAQSVADVLAAALERERVERGRAAVSAFGRFALESRDLAVTIGRAVDVVTRVLEAPMGAVVRLLGRPGRLAMVHVRGPVGLALGEEYEVDLELFAAHVLSEPLIIGDWCTEARFPPPRVVHAARSVASISVTVLVQGLPWGRLEVMDTAPRQFSDLEVDVISSVADVLAAALERERVEREHAVVAAFGRFVLESRDVSVTMERAVDVVLQLLDAPMCALFCLVGPQRMQVVHGRGSVGLVAGEQYDVPEEVPAAAIHPGGWTRVTHWHTEGRIPRPPVASATGMASMLVVSVLAGGKPWGRLAVMDTTPRQFTDTEVDFLQSVGHVLAASLERHRVEHAQAAVAAFDRFALAARDITATIERAVQVVTRVLEAPMGCVVRLLGRADRSAMPHSRGPVGVVPGERFEAD